MVIALVILFPLASNKVCLNFQTFPSNEVFKTLF